MADETNTNDRITQFSELRIFASQDVPDVRVETLLDVEILVTQTEDVSITKGEERIQGIGMLYAIVESGEVQKTLTFSAVLIDQLHSVPAESYPVRGRITREGRGNRKYYIFV